MFAFLLLIFAWPVYADENETQNNKFGMSLLQPTEDDIKKTAELVNSNGGDYGYVTLVVQENDRDKRKWQDIFEKLREHRLIPIIRLATQPQGEVWRRPEADDAEQWADFLDSLTWVVKKRYIVLFNEPNHGQEWGGETDPEGYANVALSFAKKLKEKNKDFFVMLAGFDASAPDSPPVYEDEERYMREVINAQSSIFNYIDGWASHSYPNPGFSGSPWDSGRKSIRGYEWELNLLKELGVQKDLPVFITETGWENKCQLSVLSCQNEIADNYKIAYERVWGPDRKVTAVTPFVFSYQSPPFLGFSWKVVGDGFYPQYQTVQEIQKSKGDPEIYESGVLSGPSTLELVASSQYRLKFRLHNTGQGFWDRDAGYRVRFDTSKTSPFEYVVPDLIGVKPHEETELSVVVKTKDPVEKFQASLILEKEGSVVLRSNPLHLVVDPFPSFVFRVGLAPKIVSEGDDFELQIFDSDESLVYRKKGVSVRKGKGIIEKIQNIALGGIYRVVLLKPYYLPRQTFIQFHKGENEFSFKKMLPLDFSNDGKLGWDDCGAFFKNFRLILNLIP